MEQLRNLKKTKKPTWRSILRTFFVGGFLGVSGWLLMLWAFYQGTADSG